MSPLDKEVWAAIVAVTYERVDAPINVTGKQPSSRRNDVVTHGLFKDQMTKLIGDIACDWNVVHRQEAHAGGE